MGGGLMGVEKIMILDGRCLEMLMDGCLDDLEGKMRSHGVWKVVLQVGKKEE